MQTLQRSTLIALSALAAALLLFAQSRTSVSSASTQARSTPVRDGLVITQNMTLAPGTYKISDPDADGVIQIRADNITLDGTGVTLVGDGKGFGIRMNGHQGLTLKNFNVSGYLYGVHISNASNVLIQNSNISGNHKDTATTFLDIGLDETYGGGIFFRNVSSSTVQDNTLTNQSTGLEMVASNNNRVLNNVTSSGPANNEAGQNSCWGVRLSASSSNLVRGTIADYVDRVRYGHESGDSAGILLVSGSNGNRIISNSLTHSGDGFFIGNSCQRASHNNYVYGNDGSHSPHNAFECTFSGGNVFDRNTANASDYGFWLGYSGTTRVTNNEINGNRSAGIAVEHGVGNEFDRNTISRNPHGVRLWADNNNCLFPDCGTTCPSARYRIHHNNVTLNADGVRIENSSDVLVWRNQITNNANQNVYTSGASSPVRVEQNNLTCQGTAASGEPVRSAAPCRYAAYNEVAAGRDVVALRNWWGTTSAASIIPLIFDREDDPARSRVLYNPFLLEPIPATSGASGPGVGQWMTTEPLKQASAAPFADRGQQLIFYNNRVYVFGGQGPGGTPQTGVYYAALRPDGTAGVWTPTTPLPAAFRDHVVARIGNRVYLITGANEAGAVYFAPILSNGSLGAWTSVAPLSPTRRSFAAVSYGDNLYAAGGYSSGTLSSVKYTRALPDGTLGRWAETSPLPEPIQSHTMVAYDGVLYVFAPTGRVYYAYVTANGSLGEWAATTPLPHPMRNYATFEEDGYVYLLGGDSGGVYYAPIREDDTLGAWQPTAGLPQQFNNHRVGASGGYVYALGGNDASGYKDTVYYSQLAVPAGCVGGEVVTAPFTGGLSGGTSTLTYRGFNTVTVTGVGQASGRYYGDAFYLFADGDGNPITPQHHTTQYNWALAINGQHAEAFIPGRQVPAYRPDHRYTFRINAPSGPLTFGVGDAAGADNTGRYVIGLCGGTAP